MTIVLRNANVFTAVVDGAAAQAIAYDRGRIVYVGEDDPRKWEEVAGDDAQVVDLFGKTVIPGFVDSHVHPAMVAMSSWHIKVPLFDRAEDLLVHIKDYAEKHPKEESPFLYFEYYPTKMFGKDGPRKETLDAAISDRPCLCQDFGDHMHWVNSKMLELMEVDAATPDPVPGIEIFVRDKDGNPTGWIKEMAWLYFADKMYEKIGWRPPEDIDEEMLLPVLDFFTRNGVTALFDAKIESEKQLHTLKTLDEKGGLRLYYNASVRFWRLEDLPEKIRVLKDYREKYEAGHIKIQAMKTFLDGTNESGNSALLAPHVCDPAGANFGEISMGGEELKQCFLLCNEEGVDVHIHMVGDRAFRAGCDAVEAAKLEAAGAGAPWRIQVVFAHCELVDPGDMGRPAGLGIGINSTCHWAGGYFGEEAKNFITEEKWDSMYQFNPMISSGAQVAFSSDVITYYELERANPFFGMQVAATRIDPEFPMEPGRYENSMRPLGGARVPVRTLLEGYTRVAAEQLRLGETMGSLKAGKLANLCVVSGDPLKTDPLKLKDIQIEAVIFEGALVHGRRSLRRSILRKYRFR